MLAFIIFIELAEFGHGNKDSVPRRQLFAGSGTKPTIVFPPPVSAQWEEQVIKQIVDCLYYQACILEYSLV